MPLTFTPSSSRRLRSTVAATALVLGLGMGVARSATVTFAQFQVVSQINDGQERNAVFTGTTSQPVQDLADAGFDNLDSAARLLTRNSAAGTGSAFQSMGIGKMSGNPGFTGAGSAANFVPANDASISFPRPNVPEPGLNVSPVKLGPSKNAEGFFRNPAATGQNSSISNRLPTVLPEANACTALGFMVGVVGLWELIRCFRRGWVAVNR